ncbi:MAG: CDP-glucose 4,6-dehydratase [Desulfotomaculaceae bacterium]|nr:CDP-glucose 4,6-dehydratase [Desulfotomaculaceae bacterium]MDD4766349.1 CDP-glucose 4,6-dehydratase [Desulfotomaculaceae bacterium]
MRNEKFWQSRKVFVTGHTGFKGAWLCLWLYYAGASVTGYALGPPTTPSLFAQCRVDRLIDSRFGDVRDAESLTKVISLAKPEIIFHLAAQSLVGESYSVPRATYEVNVMGTVNLFEAVRRTGNTRAVINVTSDKCYENKECLRGYREDDPLGGYDPYSSSKACSELISSAYRNSFFNPRDYELHGVGAASARAGNVIGGGDWAKNRLVPDCMRALLYNERVIIRNPGAVRPWQHVLEPLGGYMTLAEKLCENGPAYAEAWNFGPTEDDMKPVEWVVRHICARWGRGASYEVKSNMELHEARYLKLDSLKARTRLSWKPKWSLEKAIDRTLQWTFGYEKKEDIREVCLRQINDYVNNTVGER